MRTLNSILKLTVLSLLILGASSAYAGTMTVNTSARGFTCDSSLTVDEAGSLGVGNMTRPFSDGEKNQISGVSWALVPPYMCENGVFVQWAAFTGAGSGVADTIRFADSVGAINGIQILGRDDSVDGLKANGQKMILEGVPGCTSCPGIALSFDSGTTSSLRNLIIRNFSGNGISSYSVTGGTYEGLEIYGNGGNGILLSGYAQKNARNVTIKANKIYGNGGAGISVVALAGFDRANQNILIMDNLIGTSDGTTRNGNSVGVYLENTVGVTIGDLDGTTRNIISANNIDGITLNGLNTVATTIVDNFIGTGTSSSTPLGNGASGVALLAGAGSSSPAEGAGNAIGVPLHGNVISANNFGIFIADANTSKNTIKGNFIGTNTGANTDVGNLSDGILLGGGTFDNAVGGTGANDGNWIAFNRNGIYADGGIRNSIRGNHIFSNDALGIELTPAGATPNDPGDADSGPNNLQNYPVITYVRSLSASVNIEGTLNSAPSQSFSLDFFGNTAADPSGFGEGRNYLGSTLVTTNAAGNASFNVSFAVPSSSTASWVTATATDSTGNTSEFSAVRNICEDMRFSPSSYTAGAGGVSDIFVYLNSTGCTAPTASTSTSWISVGSIISGMVNFTVAPNTGPQRLGTISVAYNNGTGGQTTVLYSVTQSNGCTFSISPTSQNFSATGSTGTVTVTASQSGCAWTSTNNSPSLLNITAGGSGNGSGGLFYSVSQNSSGSPRVGTLTIAGQTFTVNQSNLFRAIPFDFDGDGRTDISAFRPSNGQWWLNRSTAGLIVHTFGNSADILTPSDFTGDGKADVAIFRPSNGNWYVLRSENFSFYSFPYGSNGDIPAPADYDGDGRSDAAVFRPSIATWYIQRSTDGGSTIQAFGANGDRPVPADYDGDGLADIAIYRPSLGQWWLKRSALGVIALTFGNASDKCVPGDYTGDGKADIAIFRPATGEWLILRSENFTFYSFPFGNSSDTPAPGDYDGDGRFDAAVYRSSATTWYVQRSTAGTLIQSFGATTDIAVPSAYVR